VNRTSRALKIFVSITAVFVVSIVVKKFTAVNATTAGFALLITILLIAASWGMAESLLAAMAASLCYDYFFLPPMGWGIAEPENWVALAAFLLSSFVVSNLSNRARRRTAEARAGQIEMERLYALSRAIMLMNGNTPIGDQLASELVRICDVPGVTIYDRAADGMFVAGDMDLDEVGGRLKEAAIGGSQFQDDRSRTLFAPISLGHQIEGSVAIQGGELSDTAVQALLNLIAITLENARSRDIATRAQAARQSEEFKSTLLDGLAHEFKTPLTSIRAATTALLGASVSKEQQRQELLTIVDQEAERLNRLVSEATHVARIEAGKIQLNRSWQSVSKLVSVVLAETELQRDGRRVNVSVAADLPRAWIDSDLIKLAVRQLIDNALKYSPRRSAIDVSANLTDNQFAIRVRNEGEPLSEPERSRIFDKFYRGQNVRHQVAGTGMGLSVAREILLAHGGDVYLNQSSHRITEFVVTIPLVHSEGEGI
jgi:two-component system, OmpR family, sensor histidine kinase KdpD